jgi:hypothetical protein
MNRIIDVIFPSCPLALLLYVRITKIVGRDDEARRLVHSTKPTALHVVGTALRKNPYCGQLGYNGSNFVAVRRGGHMRSKVIRDIRLIGFTVGEQNSSGEYYTVIAWCFECNGWHEHTGFKMEPQEGVQLHRYPHCWCGSYRSMNLYDGYVIEIAGRATPDVLADYQRKHPRGLKPQGWRTGDNPIADRAA